MLLTITICYRPSFGYTDRVIIDLAMITNCHSDSKSTNAACSSSMIENGTLLDNVDMSSTLIFFLFFSPLF